MVFLGELFLDFLRTPIGCTLCSIVATIASISVPLPIPFSVPAAISISPSRAISGAATVAVIATLAKPIAMVTFSVALPVSVAASVPLSLLFALPISLLLTLLLLLPLFFAPLPTLLFPSLVFLSLFFPALLAGGPLCLTSLHFFFFLDLTFELPFLLLNRFELGTDSLPLGTASSGVGSVLLIGLCTAHSFFLGCLAADLSAPKPADVRLDCGAVNQRTDDLLCFLVDATAIQGAINKGGSLTAL